MRIAFIRAHAAAVVVGPGIVVQESPHSFRTTFASKTVSALKMRGERRGSACVRVHIFPPTSGVTP
jgi:hypothetical protein